MKLKEINDYEILSAKVLCPNDKVNGHNRTGLLKLLYFSAIEPFEGSLYEGDYKVRPGYAYDKFYLNWVDGSFDMSLHGLIHHIMASEYHHSIDLHEEKLYNLFLNKRQIKSMEDVVENYPESIYRPEYESKIKEHEKENELVNNTLDLIYNISIKYIGQILLDTGADVEAFNDAGYEIAEGSEYLIENILDCGHLTNINEILEEYDPKNVLDQESRRFIEVVHLMENQ